MKRHFPEDYAQLNRDRSERARKIVEAYKESVLGEGGPIDSGTVVDLIADLLHLTKEIDQGDDPIESTIRIARNHFNAEILEEETGEPH